MVDALVFMLGYWLGLKVRLYKLLQTAVLGIKWIFVKKKKKIMKSCCNETMLGVLKMHF